MSVKLLLTSAPFFAAALVAALFASAVRAQDVSSSQTSSGAQPGNNATVSSDAEQRSHTAGRFRFLEGSGQQLSCDPAFFCDTYRGQ